MNKNTRRKVKQLRADKPALFRTAQPRKSTKPKVGNPTGVRL